MSMPTILPLPDGQASLAAKSSMDMETAINNAFEKIRNDVQATDDQTNTDQ